MMIEPIVYCEKCGKRRSCMKHLRAEFPPEAARKWLKKNHAGCDGAIKYRAGLGLAGKRTYVREEP